LLDQVVGAITADHNLRVRIMLRDEYGLPDAVRSPWRASVLTFSAFLFCGLVPPYSIRGRLERRLLDLLCRNGPDVLPDWCAQESMVGPALVVLRTGTLALGGGAAMVAYAIGAWLRGLTG